MNILCSRGQFVLAGGASTAFGIEQSYITSIYMQFRFVQQPIQGLSLTPCAIDTIPTTKEIYVVIEHMFENNAAFFDFFSLPYNLTNVQMYLFSETTNLLYILSGVRFVQDIMSQPDQATASKRAITFKALDIITPGNI
jgi:hypothetical protein